MTQLTTVKNRGLSLFDNFFNDDFFNLRPTFNTIFETNCAQDDQGNVILEIEVPGFNKDNIEVEVSDGIMTIQGETKNRKIYKRYSLGNIEEVDASINDGILTLKLIEPEKQVKKIELV